MQFVDNFIFCYVYSLSYSVRRISSCCSKQLRSNPIISKVNISKFRCGLLRLPKELCVIIEYPEMLCCVQKLLAFIDWRAELLLFSCFRIMQNPKTAMRRVRRSLRSQRIPLDNIFVVYNKQLTCSWLYGAHRSVRHALDLIV